MSERYKAIKTHLEGTPQEPKKGKVMRWKDLLMTEVDKEKKREPFINYGFAQRLIDGRIFLNTQLNYFPTQLFSEQQMRELVQKAKAVLDEHDISLKSDDPGYVHSIAVELARVDSRYTFHVPQYDDDTGENFEGARIWGEVIEAYTRAFQDLNGEGLSIYTLPRILTVFEYVYNKNNEKKDDNFLKLWWDKCHAEVDGLDEVEKEYESTRERVQHIKLEDENEQELWKFIQELSDIYNPNRQYPELKSEIRARMIKVAQEVMQEVQVDPQQELSIRNQCLENVSYRIHSAFDDELRAVVESQASENSRQLAYIFSFYEDMYRAVTGKNDFNVQFFEKLKNRLAFYEGLEANLDSDQ